MNVQHLRRVIRDQIERAQLLGDEIPCGSRHAALGRLATSCKSVLEEQVLLLRGALALLDGRVDEACTAKALKILKHTGIVIDAIEAYGMPPLHCQSEQAVFLNDVLSRIHSETGLPFPCPAVSCTSSEYYFSHQPTNTVHAPLSEAAFLLHMPDFYHELGHLLLDHSGHDAKFKHSLAGVASAAGHIDHWYQRLMDKMECESASTSAQDRVKWMWTRWRLKWTEESFCDLFALFAVGPAYAYSNLHLVSKSNQDMYGLDLFADQEHPAGEARMRLLDAGMRLLGHDSNAQHIRKKWNAMAQFGGDPPPGYDHAFPSTLLQEIAEAILTALERSGLRGYSSTDVAQGSAGGATVASLLNDAWRGFWGEEDGRFRDLEKKLIAKLASTPHGNAT